jgi:hypothetical protein
MWYLAGVSLFVVGAICAIVAGALVLDTALANERRGLPWHEGIGGGWVVMGLGGVAVEVVGFVLASIAA